MTMEFLYPISTKYPFDEVCGQIVRALEARNFDVPGFRVEFSTYGSGEQKMRHVNHIDGEDFRIWFHRPQRLMPGGRWNDIAAVGDIAIPRKKLCVYDDESATLLLYVGQDWDADRDVFLRSSLESSGGEPRTRLLYEGACFCSAAFGWASGRRHLHEGRRPPVLVSGRAQGDEPKQLDTAETMEEFRDYLGGLLIQILAHPEVEPEHRVDPLANPDPIPFPESIGPLFCFGDEQDAGRILQGHSDPRNLAAWDRYGMEAGGSRLMNLGIRNDGTVPDIAYDGFLWCGINTDGGIPNQKSIPGHFRYGRDLQVFHVRPKSANDIYVADHAPYEKLRELVDQAIAATPPDWRPREYTREQFDSFNCARARTIVPIAEYKGDYSQPIVLVRRELGLDEVVVA